MSVIEDDLKALRAEIETLRKDFARATEALGRAGHHGADEAMARARKSANHLRDEASKAVHGAIDEFEEKPLTGVLMVFGAGVLLGLLFGRR